MSQQISVRIHKQNRKSMVMKLTPVGIVVFIPQQLKEDSALVRRFIEQGLKKLGNRVLPAPTEEISPARIRALVDEWAERIGVQPKRVQMRDMYRKWGSCSSTGNITLNNALCRLPFALVEYVVCHELVHMIVFNHGKEFKALMSEHMPDWKEREQTLDAILAPK
jgi:hypothetical protein